MPGKMSTAPTRAKLIGPSFAPVSVSISAGLLCGAAICIFLLPLFVPVHPTETVSTSYLAGFNNRVAVIAAAAFSVLFLIAAALRSRSSPPATTNDGFRSERLSLRFTFPVAGLSALVLALSARFVIASHDRYLADAGYFIEQATTHRDTGRALYTQLEFAYGPLLLLPEVYLSRLLHLPVTVAYYVVLVLESTLGLLLLAFVLNELPIRRNLRRAGLILLAIGAITPHLGLNYTWFRFITPFALLIFSTRGAAAIHPWRCMLLLALSEALALLVSPELGLALAIGILTYGLARFWTSRQTKATDSTGTHTQAWPWLLTASLPLAFLVLILFTLGRPYLRMTASFSRGALNLPVGPYPHLLVYLFAVVWLVPVALGRRALPPRDPAAARMLAFYATSLAFLPAALGRCDPLHVVFDGVGIFLLSLVAISTASPRGQKLWIVALAVVVLWNHVVNERLFSLRTAVIARQAVMPHLPRPVRSLAVLLIAHGDHGLARVLREPRQPDFYLDTAALDRLVGPAVPIATPIEITPITEKQLQASRHYDPGYYAFWVDMMNPVAEDHAIREADAHQWMLLPTGWRPNGLDPHLPAHSSLFQGINLHYRQRNPIPYEPGRAFFHDVQQHWTAVEDLGPYTLYEHQVGMTGASPFNSTSP